MFKVKIYTKLYGLGGENGCLVFISLFFPFPGDIALHCVCVSVCFHVHHLIKVRMRVPEQESPLRGTQVFKALGQMLKAGTAEVSFRRGGTWGPH